jgi:hypothetical protein
MPPNTWVDVPATVLWPDGAVLPGSARTASVGQYAPQIPVTAPSSRASVSSPALGSTSPLSVTLPFTDL